MITSFKIFESENNITIPDVAWLYLLHYVYHGKLKIKSWATDNRMNGITCQDALSKFDCVKIEDQNYVSTDDCVKIIDNYFGSKNFKEAVNSQKKLEIYDEEYRNNDVFNRKYPISEIGYKLFIRFKNPNIDNAFDKIQEMIRNHFNSQLSLKQILEKISKMRQIDKWNYKTAYDMFDGNIPEKITIYRGLKNEYDPNYNLEYSCWTTSKDQGERFAKFLFSGGYQFKPKYSNNPTMLVSEVNFDDITVFIGGDESEVIMKGDVEIKEIIKVKI
ncbi:hypothetical protein M0Q97_05675 [Candidatus Dojkabacteria bacterium]|jgi:hypothetical protein|nr:hypothetical protein [Candidatus Dojkabacteria bacterium]